MHESRFGSYGNFVVRSRLCLFYPCTSGADPETIPLDNRPIHGVASTFNPEEASLHLRSSLRAYKRFSRYCGPIVTVSHNVKVTYRHPGLADQITRDIRGSKPSWTIKSDDEPQSQLAESPRGT
jgi:hypothetical protein